MRTNALKFKQDIKEWVALKEKNPHWMHPIYCAYYIVKHQILDHEKWQSIIEDDIKRSYKALNSDYYKRLFRKVVDDFLNKYQEETVCTDK